MKQYKIIDFAPQLPMVSIAILAYNHELFIAEAIEGALMQETSFPYKIVIAEDCSTDKTREIVLKYQKKYPEKITLILQNKNVGSKQNNIDILSNLDGKYIATCEGDDYWTDPLKLQKQVDFLEQNHHYIAASHHRYINENGNLTKEESNKNIFTQCLVFRNVLKPSDYDYLSTVFNADSFLKLILEIKGQIEFMDFYGAVYRYNALGAYSSLSKLEKYKRGLDSLNKMKIYLNKFEKNAKNEMLLKDITNSVNGIIVFNCFFDEELSSKTKVLYFLKNYTNNNFLRTSKDFFKILISYSPNFFQSLVKIIIPLPKNSSGFN